MVFSEDSFLLVCVLTPLLIFSISTLEIVITLELFWQADLPSSPPAIPCPAHQIILLIALVTIWRKTVELVTSTVPTL